MQLSVFFDLPEVQQVWVLGWLKWKDIGKLDSAVCSQERRANFLTVVSPSFCIFGKIDKHLATESTRTRLEWAMMRGMVLKEIELNHVQFVDVPHRRKILQHFGPTLQVHTIPLYADWAPGRRGGSPPPPPPDFDLYEVLRDVAEHCSNGLALNFVGSWHGPNIVCCDNLSYLPPCVQTLELEHVHASRSLLRAICSIPELNSLTMSECSCAHVSASLASVGSLLPLAALDCSTPHVCALFRNVTELTLSGVLPTDVLTLTQQCPYVQQADLNISTGVVDTTEARQIADNCHDLEHLTLCAEERRQCTSEDAVLVLVKSCLKLTMLITASSNLCMTYDDDEAYTEEYAGSRLKIIAMHCDHASTLHTISTLCPHLRALYLRQPKRTPPHNQYGADVIPLHCVEQALHYVATSGIKTLGLEGYTSMANEHLLQLMHSDLTTLHLAQADQIDDQTLLTRLPTLHNLGTLKLSYCCRFTSSLVLRIPKACHALRVYWFHNFAKCGCYGESYSHDIFREMMKLLYPRIVDY